ncbi:MAG TPA: TspO/MBR family protein [Nitrososphaera sp.]|nr:TspO/MBR family protein [Nitrososphaera sp.]
MVGQKSFLEAFGNTRSLLRLAISVAIPLSAGAIGAIFTADSVETWYQLIEKPWFTPPNWLFGPAWTVLYVLMGISLYLVWRKTTIDRSKHGTRPAAFAAFGTQLGLNALWSFLFFGLRSPQLAFAEIVILLASIIVTIIIFSRVSRLAAGLMLPYVGWVTFASALNLGVWLVNSS